MPALAESIRTAAGRRPAGAGFGRTQGRRPEAPSTVSSALRSVIHTTVCRTPIIRRVRRTGSRPAAPIGQRNMGSRPGSFWIGP